MDKYKGIYLHTVKLLDYVTDIVRCQDRHGNIILSYKVLSV